MRPTPVSIAYLRYGAVRRFLRTRLGLGLPRTCFSTFDLESRLSLRNAARGLTDSKHLNADSCGLKHRLPDLPDWQRHLRPPSLTDT